MLLFGTSRIMNKCLLTSNTELIPHRHKSLKGIIYGKEESKLPSDFKEGVLQC